VARVPLIDPSEMADDDARAVTRSGGLNVFRMVANAPSVLRPWMRLSHRLLTETDIHPRLRELAILRIGALCSCPYELSQHEGLAVSLGATADEVAAVLAGDLSGLPAGDRAVLELVGRTVEAGEATDEEVQAVRALLGDRGLVELMMLTAHYMGLAAVLNVLDVDIDEEGRLQLSSTR